MLTKTEIIKRLQDRNATVVAERTGLSVTAVNCLKRGKTNPRDSTLEKLSDYLKRHP